MDLKKIANFFFEIASMRRITRAHWQIIQWVTENIADHSFRVAVIWMILAKMENCDENKVLKMCLFHDVAEARIWDANFINQQYSHLKESEARTDQMNGLPIKEEVLEILWEFEKRESKEAIVAKDADCLDQLLLEQEHFYKDEKNRKIWQAHTMRRIKTESAKKLAEEVKESNPFDWLYKLAEEKAWIKI